MKKYNKYSMIISQIVLTAFISFILVNANAATNEANNIAEDLNLSADATEQVSSALESATKKNKPHMMFCTEIGAAAIGDIMDLHCRNLKGKKINLSFVGYGASIGLQGGLAILYPKKGSRFIKEGTYRHSRLGGLYVGAGLMGISIHNDNHSINYRVKGITLGIGFNASEGLILVKELN